MNISRTYEYRLEYSQQTWAGTITRNFSDDYSTRFVVVMHELLGMYNRIGVMKDVVMSEFVTEEEVNYVVTDINTRLKGLLQSIKDYYPKEKPEGATDTYDKEKAEILSDFAIIKQMYKQVLDLAKDKNYGIV